MQKIADLRANAERRLREASAVRDEYLKTWKRLQDTLTARKQTADQLIQSHDRIAGIRARYNETIETRLNQYFAGHMKISLRFQAGRDTRQFSEEIIRFKIASAFATQYKSRRIPDILAAHFNPVTLVQALLTDDTSVFAGRQLPDEAVDYGRGRSGRVSPGYWRSPDKTDDTTGDRMGRRREHSSE